MKDTVIFMKVRQKPMNKDGGGISPTTTPMHRGALGESGVFKGRGMSEGLETAGNKGAQDGKTPLGLWQSNRTEEIIC